MSLPFMGWVAASTARWPGTTPPRGANSASPSNASSKSVVPPRGQFVRYSRKECVVDAEVGGVGEEEGLSPLLLSLGCLLLGLLLRGGDFTTV